MGNNVFKECKTWADYKRKLPPITMYRDKGMFSRGVHKISKRVDDAKRTLGIAAGHKVKWKKTAGLVWEKGVVGPLVAFDPTGLIGQLEAGIRKEGLNEYHRRFPKQANSPQKELKQNAKNASDLGEKMRRNEQQLRGELIELTKIHSGLTAKIESMNKGELDTETLEEHFHAVGDHLLSTEARYRLMRDDLALLSELVAGVQNGMATAFNTMIAIETDTASAWDACEKEANKPPLPTTPRPKLPQRR